MHRRSIVVLTLLLCAFPIFGETRYIVEFREPPRAAFEKDAAGSDAVHARFRADLADLRTNRAMKTASPPRITREFSRLLSGAAVELEDRAILGRILELPYVANVHPDRIVSADGSPSASGPSAASPAPTSGGRGIVVAVIDSGIDYNHPALGGGFGAGRRVVGGYDFVNDDADPMDDFRHGTHVAGIVGARSPEVTGLAPEVSLLAYKVLDAAGKGLQSDVIAALERAVDPNGDGDPSDRADVINLSLGSPGFPDDPVAKAADRATGFGAVVVAAVGNSGLDHDIASPALARTVIAVGAIDGGAQVAEFSARGPAAQTGAVKPDILAPGVLIRSTAIGGGTLTLSGTSMAAPFISAIAARILESHTDWSPERVRSAILSAGVVIPGTSVTAQGAGRIDVTTAFNSSVYIQTTALGFGAIDRSEPVYEAVRTITLRSEYDVPISMTTHVAALPPGVRIEVSPERLELQPGEERSFTVRLEIDHAVVDAAPDAGFSMGGWISLLRGSEEVAVPWSFVRAARVLTRFEQPVAQFVWSTDRATRGSVAALDPFTFEALLEPGTWDLALVGESGGDVSVVVREGLEIDGETRIDLRLADALHEVRWEASDPSGGPLSRESSDDHLYTVTGRILFSEGERKWSIELPAGFETIRASSFGSRWSLLLAETTIDMLRRRIVVGQHPPVSALGGNTTLRLPPSSYAAQPIRLVYPGDAGERNLWLLPRGFTRRAVEMPRRPEGIGVANVGPSWEGTVWMTPETHGDYASGVQIALHTGEAEMQGFGSLITPTIRRRAEGFLATRGMDPMPVASELVTGGVLEWGRGLVWPSVQFTASRGETGRSWSGSLELVGDRNELRRREKVRSAWRLLDESGSVIAGGTMGAGGFGHPSTTARRFELLVALPESEGFESSTGALAIEMAEHGDVTPPTLTSFAVTGADGTPIRTISAPGAKLGFSAADGIIAAEGTTYLPIDEQSTRAWYRRGSGAWIPLPIVLVREDAGDGSAGGRAAAGFLYEADLTFLGDSPGVVSFRTEVVDRSGNRSTWTLEPAVRLQPTGGRRRAIRR